MAASTLATATINTQNSGVSQSQSSSSSSSSTKHKKTIQKIRSDKIRRRRNTLLQKYRIGLSERGGFDAAAQTLREWIDADIERMNERENRLEKMIKYLFERIQLMSGGGGGSSEKKSESKEIEEFKKKLNSVIRLQETLCEELRLLRSVYGRYAGNVTTLQEIKQREMNVLNALSNPSAESPDHSNISFGQDSNTWM